MQCHLLLYIQTCSSEHTYYFLFLAQEGMALQSFIELALGDVGEDLILSFVCCAVRYSAEERNKRLHLLVKTLIIK